MKEIQLTKGYVAKIDDEDVEKVTKYRWMAYVNNKGSVCEKVIALRRTNEKGPDGKRLSRGILLSRYIMGIEERDVQVDFQDGDTLNCQKSNLVLQYAKQMRQAAGKMSHKADREVSSEHKGVYWNTAKQKWYAQCTVRGKRKHLGTFDNEEDAAIAYDKAAIRYYGAYAAPNILPKPDPLA